MQRSLRLPLAALVLAVGLVVQAPSGQAADVDVIGNATKLKPEVGARLQGKARSLEVGSDLHRDEQVWTSIAARLDITFIDGSKVTLGENARLVLDEFVLPEGGNSGTQILRSLGGAFRFMGGVIDRGRTSSLKIVTPIATMTVRGTEFFAGPIDGAYGVFVYSGEVEVATAAGSVTLREGEGTTLTSSRVAPTAPIRWRAPKIARANALVGY